MGQNTGKDRLWDRILVRSDFGTEYGQNLVGQNKDRIRTK
jgi:hypothetical protein